LIRLGSKTPHASRYLSQRYSPINPITSSCGTPGTRFTPAARIEGPPIPISSVVGSSVMIALAKWAPWRSPEASPVTIKILILRRGHGGRGIAKKEPILSIRTVWVPHCYPAPHYPLIPRLPH